MSKVATDGAPTPRPPDADADTDTRFVPDTTESSTAVTVTRPVLVVALAAMVSVFPVRVKSPDTAGDTAAADTVNVVASVVGCDSTAVTVERPPFSMIAGGVSTRVAVAVASSSVRVRVAFAGSAAPCPPDAAPETVTLLSGASTALSFAVTVTTPALVVEPAAMVRVVAVLRAKSAAAAPVPAAAATVTVNAALDAPDKVAVTVETPPDSEIEDGPRTKLNVGRVSSSVRVSDAPVTAPAPWPLAKVAATVTLRPAVP